MKHARWSLALEISSGELASFCASAALDGGDAGERGLCRLRRFRLLKETWEKAKISHIPSPEARAQK